MKKTILILCMLASSLIGRASHVAGYDLTLVNIKNTNGSSSDVYKFRLRFYRDVTGISIPTSFTFTIYKASDNSQVANFNVTKVNPQTFISKSLSDCYPASGNHTLELGIYESPIINLNSYNVASGYYVSCTHNARNEGIKNVQGSSSGYKILFTMDFPRLSTGSNTRYNSSPEFKKLPFSKYQIFKANTLDWSATDLDGDSLVYSLAQPLDQGTTKPSFQTIPYAQGYNLNFNILDGSPDLSINSNTGIINFIPTQLGKYLIAIKVEEYRNISGVPTKIGEVRRELQIEIVLVPEGPPSITHSKDSFANELVDTIKLGETYNVFFTGTDLQSDSLKMYILPNVMPGENILDPNKYGAKWGETGQLDSGSNANNLVIQGLGTVQGQFYWKPKCQNPRSAPYKFSIVLRDQTCPTNYYDTMHVTLYVTAKANNVPYFISPDTLKGKNNILKYYVRSGGMLSLSSDSIIRTYDKDSSDIVNIIYRASNSNGTNFNSKIVFSSIAGLINSTANLNVSLACTDIRPEPYIIQILAYDNNCPLSDTAILTIQIFVKPRNDVSEPICAMTIDSSSNNCIVYWNKVPDINAKYIRFFIRNHITQSYNLLYQKLNNDTAYFTMPYTSLAPQYLPIQLKLEYLDDCGNRSIFSSDHSMVLLGINTINQSVVNLGWTPLVGADVKMFKVWRKIGTGPYVNISTLSKNILSYTENFIPNSYYKIEVVRTDTCTSFAQNNINFSVYSNEVSNALTGLDYQSENRLKVYPNPSNAILNIELNSTLESSCALYNAQGKEMLKQNFMEKCSLDIQSLPKGIYLLKVNNLKDSFVEKVLVW